MVTEKEVCNSTNVCINCGQKVKELFKKYSNAVKAINCEKCHKIADKYIEFEPVMIIVDSLLLSKQAYRHLIFNRDFKLFWKLSLMLLLLESLMLWREKHEELDSVSKQHIVTQEHGFYFCCLYKIFDFMLCTVLLVAITIVLQPKFISKTGTKQYSFQLFKANSLANFSKFFLLPIMLWRENTTEIGVALHRGFVTAHHLCSLVFVNMVVVGQYSGLQTALIVLPVYIIKEFLMQYFFDYLFLT